MTSARSARFYPAAALSKWYSGGQDDAVSFMRRCHDLCPGVENAITGYFEEKRMRCYRCGAERQCGESRDQRAFRVLELQCTNEDTGNKFLDVQAALVRRLQSHAISEPTDDACSCGARDDQAELQQVQIAPEVLCLSINYWENVEESPNECWCVDG